MDIVTMRAGMREGRVMLGLGARLARSTEIASLAKALGFDWLFVDMEHNALTADDACRMAVAAWDAGVPALVRVPGHHPEIASRLLDGGAAGIVVPHVDAVAEILPFVQRCRFAPEGRRSLGGLLPQLGWRALPAAELMAQANAQAFLVAMIESPQAVAGAAAIAAVPGVDALLVGTNDLAIEMGIPGELGSPRVAEAYRTVLDAAAAAGKVAGIGGVYTKDLLERYLPMGFRFALLGSDLSFLMRAAGEQVKLARGITGG
jgi:2-keto-3-deoxy-L-rhamnonate aldolase RhmA